jgi:hypothetical protein
MSESETLLHMQIAKYLNLADAARHEGNDELAETLTAAAARVLIKLSDVSATANGRAAEPEPATQQR